MPENPSKPQRLPLLATVALGLFVAIAMGFILYIGRSILVPLSVAFFMAILLLPVCKWFERRGLGKAFAAAATIVVVFLVIAGLTSLVTFQLSAIGSDIRNFGGSVDDIADKLQRFLVRTFSLDAQQVGGFFDNLLENSSSFFGSTLSFTADLATAMALLFIGIFFFMYYRDFFLKFLLKVIADDQKSTLHETIDRVRDVLRNYTVGLLIVMAILAVLNSVGLWIIGIEYALFFGVFAALLTIVPYIGTFLGSLLPILFALATKDSFGYPVAVAIMFWLVQLLEGNFITPNIIGKQVSLNPFVAILGLFVGGMLWGPVGLILSIPVLGITKSVFDHVDDLKPYGYLLGNPYPDEEGSLSKMIRKKAGLANEPENDA